MVEPLVEIEMGLTPTRLEVAGALIDTVLPAVAVACDSEIGPLPTSTMRVPETPVSPAVFPPVDTPAGIVSSSS